MEILATILSIIATVGAMYGLIKKSMKDEILSPLEKRIDKLTKYECKNFLVQYLNDIQNGVEIDPIVHQRAHEIKDKAVKLDVNSYIGKKWEELTGEKWKK